MLKEHLMKIIGIILVISLSLISNTSYNYFLAILIVATLVTELDFLQNITAIIRNSDSYFDFRKQSIQERKESYIDEEKEIIEEINKEAEIINKQPTIPQSISNLSTVHFGMIIEELALSYLERKYGKTIQSHVMLSEGKLGRITFDGVIEEKNKIMLIEVKASRKGVLPLGFVRKTIMKDIDRIKDMQSNTKKKVEYKLILIGNFEKENINRISEVVNQLSLEHEVYITNEIISFEDIDPSGALIRNNMG